MSDFLSDEQHLNEFIEASYGNDVKKVTELLDGGQDINATTTSGSTTLHIAAQNGFGNLADVLISRGIDVNILNDKGWTALHFAAYKGYVDIVKSLIKAKVDINAKGALYGRTALHYAVDQGKTDVVKLLVKLGAEISIKDKHENTPHDIAKQKGLFEIMQILKV